MKKNSNSSDSIITVANLQYFWQKAKGEILKLVYPVGSVYASFEDNSPASFIPGTSWLPIMDKVLRASSNTATGGGDSVTLTEAQLAEHTHNDKFGEIGYLTFYSGATNSVEARSGHNTPVSWSKNLIAGQNAPHNNLPAYQNLYCWYRVS